MTIEQKIEKLYVNETLVNKNIDWLLKDKNNCLADYDLVDLVRYLLVKVNNQQKEIEELKKSNPNK